MIRPADAIKCEVPRTTSASTLDSLLHVLRTRRTVREFKPNPVDLQLLDMLRATMEFAPSAGNSRPWRVVDVSATNDRAAFDTLFKSAEHDFLATLPASKQAEYRDLSLGRISDAPTRWAMCVDLAPREGHGLGSVTMPEALVHSTVCAIHTLTLAAATVGLGVSWNTSFHPDEVAQRFAMPRTWRFVALIGIGWPRERLTSPFLDDGDWQRSHLSTRIFQGFDDVTEDASLSRTGFVGGSHS